MWWGWLDLRAWASPTGLPLEAEGGNCCLVKGKLGVRLAGRARGGQTRAKGLGEPGSKVQSGASPSPVTGSQAVTEGQTVRLQGGGVDP